VRQVPENGLPHFILDRIALQPALFGALHRKDLIAPVEIGQSKACQAPEYEEQLHLVLKYKPDAHHPSKYHKRNSENL
jgi:hypothetical protein